jgi:hypothetical protein
VLYSLVPLWVTRARHFLGWASKVSLHKFSLSL